MTQSLIFALNRTSSLRKNISLNSLEFSNENLEGDECEEAEANDEREENYDASAITNDVVQMVLQIITNVVLVVTELVINDGFSAILDG